MSICDRCEEMETFYDADLDGHPFKDLETWPNECHTCGSWTSRPSHVTGRLADVLQIALRQEGLLVGTPEEYLTVCIHCAADICDTYILGALTSSYSHHPSRRETTQ